MVVEVVGTEVKVSEGRWGGSRMWLPHRGRAVGFTLTLAVEHAAECGCSARSLHCGRRLQVNQVIV